MLVLAVKTNKMPKLKNVVILSYDELFEKYKTHCKKPYWRTKEGFYLEWLNCNTINEMKQCIFIYPDNDEIANYIRQHYNVLDENNLTY